MKIIASLIAALLMLVVTATSALAQASPTPMADLMRSEGRIYVVIAVILTILAGLLIYLIRLDRKISKLEKE